MLWGFLRCPTPPRRISKWEHVRDVMIIRLPSIYRENAQTMQHDFYILGLCIQYKEVIT